MIDESARRDAPPSPNYLAHTEFGRLSFELHSLSAYNLSSLSDEGLSRLRHLALQFTTVARGTKEPQKIETAMKAYGQIKQELRQREKGSG